MGKRMLLVDDAAFMRRMLKQVLTELGHEVVGEASNGADGIAQYLKLKPDAVTMDVTMPDVDGLTALKHIRQIDFSPFMERWAPEKLLSSRPYVINCR
ncbi:MAG: response regulator [Candidatus Taylorbacteria bacterium]